MIIARIVWIDGIHSNKRINIEGPFHVRRTPHQSLGRSWEVKGSIVNNHHDNVMAMASANRAISVSVIDKKSRNSQRRYELKQPLVSPKSLSTSNNTNNTNTKNGYIMNETDFGAHSTPSRYSRQTRETRDSRHSRHLKRHSRRRKGKERKERKERKRNANSQKVF